MNHYSVFAGAFRKQFKKTHQLLAIQPCVRFLDDDKVGIDLQDLRDSEPLAHSSRKTTDALMSDKRKVYPFQQSVDQPRALLSNPYAFELGKIIERLLRRQCWIKTEVLRQIAKFLAHFASVAYQIATVDLDCARVGIE